MWQSYRSHSADYGNFIANSPGIKLVSGMCKMKEGWYRAYQPQIRDSDIPEFARVLCLTKYSSVDLFSLITLKYVAAKFILHYPIPD